MSETEYISEPISKSKYDVADYLQFGSEIHDHIEDKIKTVCTIGAKLIDVVKHIEDLIVEKTTSYLADYGLEENIESGIAFPVGININNVAAHWSPKADCEQIISRSDVVTLDYGIHFDGYIIDAAFTLAYDRKHINLLKCGLDACQTTANMVKSRTKIYDLSKNILDVVKSANAQTNKKSKTKYNLIYDLCGHQIQQYKIHMGKLIPNVGIDLKQQLSVGDIFTIEPFITTGSGLTIRTDEISHYMFNYHQKSYDDFNTNRLLPDFLKKYRTLAFNSRDMRLEQISQLNEFVRNGLYNAYPPIIDPNPDALTCQFETTLYIKSETEVINYKKHKDINQYVLC